MPRVRDLYIPGTTKISVEYVYDVHPAYKTYIGRWNFLSDSYIGGYDYYRGKHLEPFYYESTGDYEKRLRMNALDNHVKSIVGIYNSFLYRRPIYRDWGSIKDDPSLNSFLKDADLDGRSYEAFLRDLSAYVMVYGHTWCIVDKPNVITNTRAEELAQEIRPYVSIFTPENVLDWEYKRETNGLYVLTYLKVREEIVGTTQYIREYTPEEIRVYKVEEDAPNEANIISVIPNELGKIPATCVYAERSNIRGVGISAIGDIADIQRSIYEEHSEIIELTKLTNHPSLVKTASTEASAGAGAIIQIPDDITDATKPYLLQPNGQNISSLLESMRHKIESVDRAAALGGIRSVESRRLSGIGLQTEFQLLSAKLSSFAASMELAEEQIMRIWCMYQDVVWDGEIHYPRSFSIQDKANDIAMLKLAKESNPTNPVLLKEIDKRMLEIIVDDPEELNEIMDESSLSEGEDEMSHPVTTESTREAHIREMIMEGYTDQQILERHPEINQQDIVRTKANLLNDPNG